MSGTMEYNQISQSELNASISSKRDSELVAINKRIGS